MLENYSIDRRQARSTWPSEALKYQLEHLAQRHLLDTLLLADSKGYLWAASSFDRATVHLAKDIANIGFLNPSQSFSIAHDVGHSIWIARLIVGNAHLFLAAQGGRRQAQSALGEAAPAIVRILEALIKE